jgi:hypothetical protein
MDRVGGSEVHGIDAQVNDASLVAGGSARLTDLVTDLVEAATMPRLLVAVEGPRSADPSCGLARDQR